MICYMKEADKTAHILGFHLYKYLVNANSLKVIKNKPVIIWRWSRGQEDGRIRVTGKFAG